MLWLKIGKCVAEMDLSLKTFHHPAYDTRTFIWMLNNVPQVREFLHAVENEDNRKLSEELIKAFEEEVLPLHVSKLSAFINTYLTKIQAVINDIFKS